MNVFDLFASLKLDDSEYQEGLSDAEKKADSGGSKIGKALKTASVVGGAAMATIGAATIKMGKDFINGANDVASYGDTIDKQSQKLGISAQAYQEWDFILQHSGASVDSLKASMKTLTSQVDKGSEAFAQLGISEAELANLSQEELFSRVITGLQGMEEGTERAALAQELLGKGAIEMGALLNTSAEETEAMRKQVHDLGGVMSDDAVKASAKYQDAMQNMQTSMDGLKRNLMADFLPSLSTVMDGVSQIFAGNYDEGLDSISTAIDETITQITDKLPMIIELGGKLLMTLAESIIQNLPMILETGLNVIITLAQGIAASLPSLVPSIIEVILKIVEVLTNPETLMQLIDAAIQIIIGLAEGLIMALPKLIEYLPQIILNIVTALIELAPELVKASLQLIIQLGLGLINSVGKIIEAVGKVFTSIKDSFMERIQAAKEWGRDLIENFLGGIKEKWNALKETVSNIAGTIKDFLGFSEPDKGPLSNFHTFAPDMMDLFMKGISDNEGKLQAQLADAFTFRPTLMDIANTGVSGLDSGISSISSSVSGNNGNGGNMVPINVNITLEERAGRFLEVVREENDAFVKSNGYSALAAEGL